MNSTPNNGTAHFSILIDGKKKSKKKNYYTDSPYVSFEESDSTMLKVRLKHILNLKLYLEIFPLLVLSIFIAGFIIFIITEEKILNVLIGIGVFIIIFLLIMAFEILNDLHLRYEFLFNKNNDIFRKYHLSLKEQGKLRKDTRLSSIKYLELRYNTNFLSRLIPNRVHKVYLLLNNGKRIKLFRLTGNVHNLVADWVLYLSVYLGIKIKLAGSGNRKIYRDLLMNNKSSWKSWRERIPSKTEIKESFDFNSIDLSMLSPSQVRQLLEHWGLKHITPAANTLFWKMMREKTESTRRLKPVWKPIVFSIRRLSEKQGSEQIRLSHLLEYLKNRHFLDIEEFEYDAFKSLIMEDFNHLMKGEDLISPFSLAERFYMIPYIFPRKKTEFLEFFLQKLPIPHEKVDYTELKIMEEMSIDNPDFQRELFKRIAILENFFELYNKIWRILYELNQPKLMESFLKKCQKFHAKPTSFLLRDRYNYLMNIFKNFINKNDKIDDLLDLLEEIRASSIIEGIFLGLYNMNRLNNSEFGQTYKPALISAIEELNSQGDIFLDINHFLHGLKQHNPKHFLIDYFDISNFKKNIHELYEIYLDHSEEIEVFTGLPDYFLCIPKLYPENQDEFISFYLDSIPLLEDEGSYSEIRQKSDNMNKGDKGHKEIVDRVYNLEIIGELLVDLGNIIVEGKWGATGHLTDEKYKKKLRDLISKYVQLHPGINDVIKGLNEFSY